MRQISPKAITLFSILTVINVIVNATICLLLYRWASIPHQVFYFTVPLTYYLTTIFTYQLVFSYLKFPLQQIPKDSQKDFAFQMYVLYYLIYFGYFIYNTILPVPILRGFHQLLGAKIGAGSYCAGFILDPPYVKIGENSIIGFGAVLCSHAMEDEKLSFEDIIVGNHVTIGLRAMIMPGVIIEDHAIVAAGALVTKKTHIKKGEVWAGIPAKRIKLGQEEAIPSIAHYAS